MHSLSNLLDLGRRRFDLALCGHTHGGQIALPGGIPLVVPQGPLSRRYSRGRYDLDTAVAHPEIVVCDVTGTG